MPTTGPGGKIPGRIGAEDFTDAYDTTPGNSGDSVCGTGDVDRQKKGPPGEWVDDKRRSRKYEPDGTPEIDLDKPHQGYPGEHAHEWSDGKREHPGRDVCVFPTYDPPSVNCN